MKAPATESPANLRRHTIGGPERLAFKASEELEVTVELGFSKSASESVFGESAVAIGLSIKMQLRFSSDCVAICRYF